MGKRASFRSRLGKIRNTCDSKGRGEPRNISQSYLRSKSKGCRSLRAKPFHQFSINLTPFIFRKCNFMFELIGKMLCRTCMGADAGTGLRPYAP